MPDAYAYCGEHDESNDCLQQELFEAFSEGISTQGRAAGVAGG